MVYTLNFENIRSRGGDALMDKVKTSLEVIEKTFSTWNYDEIALSYNGGKDSVVLIELVNQVLTHYVNDDDDKMSDGDCPLKKLRAIFFSSKKNFKEVDKFMWETSEIYNLNVHVVDKSFKEGLKSLIDPDPSLNMTPLKAMFMGTRYIDPGGSMIHFLIVLCEIFNFN